MQHEAKSGSPSSWDANCDGSESKSYDCRTGAECLGETVQKVVSYIMASGKFDRQSCENAHVVLAEVFNNIAEHSYNGQPGGRIRTTLSLGDEGISVETTDNGIPMPGLAVPPAKLPDTKVSKDALPEGGFGWYLIHTLAPSPQYTRKGDTNILRFIVR